MKNKNEIIELIKNERQVFIDSLLDNFSKLFGTLLAIFLFIYFLYLVYQLGYTNAYSDFTIDLVGCTGKCIGGLIK